MLLSPELSAGFTVREYDLLPHMLGAKSLLNLVVPHEVEVNIIY